MANELTAEDRIAYQCFFDGIDGDGDGRIDFQEFDEMCRILGQIYPGDTLNDIFEKADKDGNNRIDFDEFVRIMPALTPMKDVYVKEFKKHDCNGDGLLTKSELQFALMTMSRFLKSDKVQALIDSVDADADGKVNYNEFLDLVPQLY